MNRLTGSSIGTLEHISQSIADILSTRIGSRVMRREYGSLLLERVDHPFNEVTRLRSYAAISMALMRWEPRISLSRVQFIGANLQGQSVREREGYLRDLMIVPEAYAGYLGANQWDGSMGTARPHRYRRQHHPTRGGLCRSRSAPRHRAHQGRCLPKRRALQRG